MRMTRRAMSAHHLCPLSLTVLHLTNIPMSAHRPTTNYSSNEKKSTSGVRLARPFSLLLPSPQPRFFPLKGLPQDLPVRLLSSQQKNGARNSTRGGGHLSRKNRLKLMVQDNAIKKAWEIFYDLQASGELDVQDCNTMLKACYSAAQMQELVDVAVSIVDVEPNIATYNMLIGMLRVEGDDEAAKKVVEEMKKAKVQPDEKTKEILNYPARGEVLSKWRTSKLASLLKQGGDGATTAARSMMDKMVENGVANRYRRYEFQLANLEKIK